MSPHSNAARRRVGDRIAPEKEQGLTGKPLREDVGGWESMARVYPPRDSGIGSQSFPGPDMTPVR